MAYIGNLPNAIPTGIATTATGTVLTLSDASTEFDNIVVLANQKEVRFSELSANGSNFIGVLAPSSLASSFTLTLPAATDTLVGKTTTDILTNKTIDSASNTLTLDLSEGTLTGTTAEFNTALSDGSFVTLAGSETLTNKTLTSPTINDPVINTIDDSNGNEEIIFTTTASAVNELTVANAATGDGPTLSATGGDSNIDLNLTPKGIGRVVLGAGKIEQIAEKVTVSATAATGTITFDVITQGVEYYTSNASGNWTLNIRGDGSNTLNSIMDTGESITIAHLVTQGGTGYYNSAVQIDGSGVTPEWQGGEAPSEGNSNSVDSYVYTIIKTANATFTVLASQTQYA